MKYLLVAFGIFCLMSCHDLHQKLYDTFHGKKEVKDSLVKKDPVSSSTIQLTTEEEQDLPETSDPKVRTTWEDIDINNVRGLKLFIKKLQVWSEQNNKDSIAASIDYPLINDENISSFIADLMQKNKGNVIDYVTSNSILPEYFATIKKRLHEELRND